MSPGGEGVDVVGRVRAIVSRRRILKLLIIRDLKVTYSDSTLGYVWTVLDPLMMGCVYWFVFDVIFDRGKAIAGTPYLLYLLAALLPWQWAGSVISKSTRSLSNQARLIRSVDVPRELWVLRVVGSEFVEYLFSIPVLLIFIAGFTHAVHPEILFIPLAMAMQWVALIGIGLALAPLTVMVTDIERIIGVVNRVLLYLCPIIYGAHAVLDNPAIPGPIREAYAWNPFTAIIGFYRAGLFPDDTPDLGLALRGMTSCLILFAVGAWIFRRLEPAVLKEI